MKKTDKLKALEKDLQRLRARVVPKVHLQAIKRTVSHNLEGLSKQKLIDLINTIPGDLFWFSDDPSNCRTRIEWEVTETEEERKLRVEKERTALYTYECDLIALENAIEGELSHMADMKKQQDEKYKNPEYIEFLRLQAKLKDQGLL